MGYSLSWGEFNQSTTNSFTNLLNDTNFADVTLACEDEKQIKAHKVILSSSSSFFQNILLKNSHPHPLIYLKGIKFGELQAIIHFIYQGRTEVSQEDLAGFIEAANELKITGLGQCRQPNQFNFDNAKRSNIKEEPKNNYPENDNSMKSKDVAIESLMEDLGDISEAFDDFGDKDLSEQFDDFYDRNTSKVLVIEDYDEYASVIEEVDIESQRDDQNQFSCNECDGKFKNSANLRQHKVSKHQGVRYDCETCGKGFSQPQAMKRHTRTVHGGARHSCDYCDLKAVEKCYIKQHMITKHSMEMMRDYKQ